jgi:hypothetical protein
MKSLHICLLFLGLPFIALAQAPDDLLPENEQIRAQRIAFITQRLQLTAEESAHFWGIETEHNEQRRSITSRYRAQLKTQPTSETEAETIIASRFAMEQELLDLRKRTHARYREKISPLKLVQLPQAEKEFRRNLLRQLRRQGNPPHRRG